MLDKVEVRTSQGAMLTLSLRNPSNGYSVEDIEGTDPVKANFVSSSMAGVDGEIYQTSKREKRNLIFTLGFQPDYVNTTVSGLRKRLYDFFMPQSEVRLRFYSDDADPVDIIGRVEDFNAPKFTKDPGAIISILCFNPDFYDPTPTIFTGTTVGNTLETNLEYPGTVDTGVIFRLRVNRSLSAFSIYHRPGDGSIRTFDFSTASPLVSGDVLRVSSVQGDKYVTLYRNGISKSYLSSMTPQSSWLVLSPGLNQIRVFAEGAAVPYEIEYVTKIGAL